MSYLLIKENDAKIFKSFMSGNEIEVGVVVPAKADIFTPGDVVDIFYGNNGDSYQAKVVKQKKVEKPLNSEDQLYVMVSLRKRK